jgi:predicted ATPase
LKLESFEIHGFRGYREKRKVAFSDLTTFVGKNDAGKSSLMDAMDLFFDAAAKLDKDDLCVSEDVAQVELVAEFSSFPEEIVLDATSTTSLSAEKLLYVQDELPPLLRIIKRYAAGKAAEVFIQAMVPEIDGVAHPILLKQADLRKFGRDLGLEDAIPGAERTKNPPWRSAIFEHFAAAPVVDVEVPITKEDAKKIWDQIRPHIPYFCLFKVDRASSDQDDEAKNPLAAAARIAIAEREEEIAKIVEGVEERATDLVVRTLEKLQEMAPELAVGLTPDIAGQPKWDGFKTTLKTEGGIPFNKRGSGTKRLVLLNFFRAEAERRSEEDGRGIIYAFEEPESSQHPENQRLLLDSFKGLSESGNSQVVLTTHSPLVAQNLPVASLKLVRKQDNDQLPIIDQVVEGDPDADGILEAIANELGVLPDSRLVALLMVEGPNDVNFFRNIYGAVAGIDPDVIDLASSQNIAIVPMGGSDLKHWVSKQYLKGAGCVEYHIYDRDCGPDGVPGYGGYVDQVNDAQDANSARLTTKRETENYLHPAAIQQALNLEVEVTDFADVPSLVSEASKNTQLAPDMGTGTAKRLLNERAAKQMNADRLRQADQADEVVGWFRDMTQIVRERLAERT